MGIASQLGPREQEGYLVQADSALEAEVWKVWYKFKNSSPTNHITPSLSLWKPGTDLPTHYSTTLDLPEASLRSGGSPEGQQTTEPHCYRGQKGGKGGKGKPSSGH